MKAKDFESHCLRYFDTTKRAGTATAGRYGVMASLLDGKWQPRASLPDIEGILAGGRQFIFDCKVCSQSSQRIDQDAWGSMRGRQISHMLDRSDLGAICFLLVHFNPRELKTRTDPEETFAVQVHRKVDLWSEFGTQQRKSISREWCRIYLPVSCRVAWELPSSRAKIPRPILLPAIRFMGKFHDERLQRPETSDLGSTD